MKLYKPTYKKEVDGVFEMLSSVDINVVTNTLRKNNVMIVYKDLISNVKPKEWETIDHYITDYDKTTSTIFIDNTVKGKERIYQLLYNFFIHIIGNETNADFYVEKVFEYNGLDVPERFI